MIYKAIAALVAAAFIAAAAAFLVAALLTPNAATSHYAHASKPLVLKGGIHKNCLDSQSECATVIW